MLLSVEVQKVESHLNQQGHYHENRWEQQPWIGLAPELLLTPYAELLEIVEFLKLPENSKWVDLGAAYGRLGVVLSIFRPLDSFVGYEFIYERFKEAQELFQRYNLKNCRIHLQDLSSADFTPEVADCYFLYDFGSRLAVQKTLADLQKIALNRKIIVVARGKGCRSWIHTDHAWLCEVNEPMHTKYYSIYRS